MENTNAIVDYAQNGHGVTVKNMRRKPRAATRFFWLVERTAPDGEFKAFFAEELGRGCTLQTVRSWFVARAGYWSDTIGCVLHQVEGEYDHLWAYHMDGTFAAELMIAEQLIDPESV